MDLHDKYLKLTDEELIKKYQDGDQSVLDYIFEKYKPLVLKLSKQYFIVGGDNDDMIQEGMIGLFSAIGDYDTSSEVTFFHFADMCIKRQMFKAIEASKRKKHSPLNEYVSLFGDDNEENGEAFSVGGDPAQLLIEAEENTSLVDRLMENLSPMEQKVFDLYMQDYDYKEIAHRLGKTEKSIDNTLTRIKQKARAL